MIITVIELHSGFITHILQDIPLLINLMDLLKTTINDNAKEAELEIHLSVLSLFFVCLVVSNQDKTFDLLTLLEKNVGISSITHYSILLINHSSYSVIEFTEERNAVEDSVM